MLTEKTRILQQYELVLEHIKNVNIKSFPGHPEPLFLISDAYPGVWLEHAFDGVAWARLCPEMAYVARAEVNLFLDNQKEDGQFPCYVLDSSNPNTAGYGRLIGFGQLQECVSFARLCYEAAALNNDRALLQKAYEKCARWVQWLRKHRMSTQNELIEMFCGFDTGHDNSSRLSGIPNGSGGDAKNCGDSDALPMIAPDVNAVYFGNLTALADMADELGLPEEAAAYRSDAERVRAAINRLCYNAEDDFYYDVDRSGAQRKYRSISITNLFCEHFFSQADAERIFRNHLMNEKEFWTPYPFSSLAADDPTFAKRVGGNDWGYYTQGLTALRALRWMDHYGFGKELETLMERWISALVASETVRFSQELDPFTGELTPNSQWYSSTMLFFV
ncbi:MAG: hypothetical protein IJC25_06040, partial [Clostridia bacterium]|nr:hypothetical protein [Clostridia bacterium]